MKYSVLLLLFTFYGCANPAFRVGECAVSLLEDPPFLIREITGVYTYYYSYNIVNQSNNQTYLSRHYSFDRVMAKVDCPKQ